MFKNGKIKFLLFLLSTLSFLAPIFVLAATPNPNFSLSNNKRIYFEISPRADAKILSDFGNTAKANKHKELITNVIKKTYSLLDNNSNLPNFSQNIDLKLVKIITVNEMDQRCKDAEACYYHDEGIVLLSTSIFEISKKSSTYSSTAIAHEFIHASAHNFPSGNLDEGIVDYLACKTVNCTPSYDIVYTNEFMIVSKLAQTANLDRSTLFSIMKNGGYSDLDKKIVPVRSEELNSLLNVGTKAKIDLALARIGTIKTSSPSTAQTNTPTSSTPTTTSPSSSSPASTSSPSSPSPTVPNTSSTPSSNTSGQSSNASSSANISIKLDQEQVISNKPFNALIQNKSTSPIKYEILVDDLKTGNMVKKQNGAIESGASKSIESVVSGIGDHKVEVKVLDFVDNTVIKSENFKLSVTEKALAQTQETGIESDSTSAPSSLPPNGGTLEKDEPCVGDTCPITNSDGDVFDVSLKKLFSEFFAEDPTVAGLESIEAIIKRIINFALDIAGIVTFIMVLWAARGYLGAYGSEEKAAMGKKTLIWALVGISVIFFAKLILLYLYETLRVPENSASTSISQYERIASTEFDNLLIV